MTEERLICPKCSGSFVIKYTIRPANISCPKCKTRVMVSNSSSPSVNCSDARAESAKKVKDTSMIRLTPEQLPFPGISFTPDEIIAGGVHGPGGVTIFTNIGIHFVPFTRSTGVTDMFGAFSNLGQNSTALFYSWSALNGAKQSPYGLLFQFGDKQLEHFK